MRIAYLSIDEVNSALAAEMAERHGISLCVVEPRDGTPGPQFDAVLCDWDFWHARTRPERLADLLAEGLSRPVALHGYGVEDDEAEALRRRGVVLFPALKAEVFQHLRQAVIAARVAAAVGCELVQEAQRAGGAA